MDEKNTNNQNENSEVYYDEEEQGSALQKLRHKLEISEKEKQEYLEGWQRAKADYVNFKRESELERARGKKTANAALLRDLISVLDHFELAFSQKEAWEKTDPAWRAGIEGIHKSLLSALEKHRVETVRPLGEIFDPARDEAVEARSVSEKERDNTVVEVLQPGYTIEGEVVRPAKVAVGKYLAEN